MISLWAMDFDGIALTVPPAGALVILIFMVILYNFDL
jgi:hypothetical protein